MKYIKNIFFPIYRFYLFSICRIFKNHFKFKSKPTKKKNVIILTCLGLGDTVDFRCIENKYLKLYPKDKYHITVLCTKISEKILKNDNIFDDFIIIDLNKEFCLNFNIKKQLKIIKKLSTYKYDILVDGMWPFVNIPSTLYASKIIKADKKYCVINKASLQLPFWYIKRTYTNIKIVNDVKISNIEMYNNVPCSISKDIDKKIEYKKFKQLNINFDIPKDYYIAFPTSSAEKKNWAWENYVQIIKKIYNKTKLKVVFCGTNSDKHIIDKIKKEIGEKLYVDLLGETNALEFIQLIKNSKFVITNDTGAYHIAVIEEIPVVIITGGYTYDSFVLYNFKDNHYKKPYVVVSKNNKCFNCHLKCIRKETDKFPCLNDITVLDAWEIIDKMIDKEKFL